MRIASLLLFLLLLSSTGCGHGVGARLDSALRRTVTPTGKSGVDFGTQSVDPKLASAVEETMAGRELGLGLFHDFTSGQEKSEVEDGQLVQSHLPSLDDVLKHGTLSLHGSDAVYTEDIVSPNPAMTGLELRGIFDTDQLTTLVKQVFRLPFDTSGHSRPDMPPLTVNWQLAGDFLGAPFSVDFDQQFSIDKSDFVIF
jgi:hypothetical protein